MIAIDCSTKGLAPPSFTLKTSPTLVLSAHSTPPHVSKVSSTASSQTSLGPCSSEGSESPKILDHMAHMLTDGDHDSIYSFGSSASMASTTVSHKSPKPHGRSLLKVKSQGNAKAPRANLDPSLKFSDSNLLSPGVQSPSSLTSHQHTPETVRKGVRQKSRVGNFVEGVARSLKSKRKPHPMSIYPEEEFEMADPHRSPLVSPEMVDHQFPLCTVFHVYYSNAKQTQLYKSVLVSEQSTSREVIKQSLERYGLKFIDPAEFQLCEVIGKWETVSGSMDAEFESSLQSSLASSPMHTILGPNTKYSSKGALAMEEFVQCYSRVLQADERPYETQFFHATPDGYSRRFELKSKMEVANVSGQNDEEHYAAISPITPVFGTTSHNRAGRRNKLKRGGESFDFTEETREHMESRKPSSVPDLSLLDCSSPDSGLELHKDSQIFTKSSIASDQSDASGSHCALYPVLNTGAFLLNLQLASTENEFLVYKLLSEQVTVTSGQTTEDTTAALRGQCKHESEYDDGKEERIELSSPNGRSEVLCTIITEEQMTGDGSTNKKYVINPGDEGTAHVNGQELTGPEELQHGDLIQLGQLHTFVFHNHPLTNLISNGKWHYRWKPVFCPRLAAKEEDIATVKSPSTPTSLSCSPNLEFSHTPSRHSSSHSPRIRGLQITEDRLSPAIPQSSEIVIIDTASHADIDQPSSPAKVVYISPESEEKRQNSKPPLARNQTAIEDAPAPVRKLSKQNLAGRTRSSSESKVTIRRSAPVSCSSNSLPYRKHHGANKKLLKAFPTDRKLMFSYSASEEDVLLELLITSLDLKSTPFKLTPSYLLAMCTEYSLKCSSPKAANRLVYKAVDYIHEAVWVSVFINTSGVCTIGMCQYCKIHIYLICLYTINT